MASVTNMRYVVSESFICISDVLESCFFVDFVIYVIHGAAHVSPHSHLGSRRHQIEFPNSTRYLFKAKMDLGSGQHMPQKQACQPQNYDKPRAVNVRGNFKVMSTNFRL